MAYEINCAERDGFVVRSEDESEALDMIKQHARQKHDMELSDDDARGMMEEA